MHWAPDGLHLILNVGLIAGLIYLGFSALSDYFTTGQYSRNITKLLGGAGLFGTAARMLFTPYMARVLSQASLTRLPLFFLWISGLLLFAAIAAFGAITYWRPMRLWRESKVTGTLRESMRDVR